MYRQRDSLQVELERIEHKKRLNAQRFQMEQQMRYNNQRLEVAKINHQFAYSLRQNAIPGQYTVLNRPPYMQQSQIYQTRYVNTFQNSLINTVQYDKQNYYQHNDYLDQDESFKTHNNQADEYIKIIYEHAKNAIEQLSTKVFLTPEEQFYYSELKDAIDFIEARQTLLNPNKSFISKLDAAQKIEIILKKHLYIY